MRETDLPRFPALLSLAALLALTAAAFYPSLQQIPRADQLGYLYDVRDYRDLWSLTGGTYALNRIIHGDELLFRPLLYVLLGTERWAFGDRTWLWQTTSLALHLATVASLYRYSIARLGKGALAWALTAWFALAFDSSDLVMWDHLGGYVLFCFLLLQALLAFDRFTAAPSRSRLASLLLWPFLACFTYELGPPLTLLLAGISYWRCRSAASQACLWRRAAAALFAVLFVYILAYAADFWFRIGIPGAPGGARAPLWQALPSFVFAAGYWTAAGFLPALLHFRIADSLRVVLASIRPTDGFEAATLLANLAIVAVLGAALLSAYRREASWRRLATEWPALMFLGLLAAAYIMIIVLGRLLYHNIVAMVADNTYYAYIFTLILALALAHLLKALAATPSSLRQWVAGCLIAIAAIGGVKIWLLGRDLEAWSAPGLAFMAAVSEARASNATGGNFTFSPRAPCPGNIRISWLRQVFPELPDDTLAAILYPDAYRPSGGRVTIVCPASGG